MSTRSLVLALFLLSLSACAPVRDGDDDSADPPVDDLEQVWEELASGSCAVLPAGGLLDTGSGYATNGLWYDATCSSSVGNAASIVLDLDSFNEEAGGDFSVSAVRGSGPSGESLSFGGDLGSLHLLAGSWGTLNGWWQGDVTTEDPSGTTIRVEAIVWKDAQVGSVVGR